MSPKAFVARKNFPKDFFNPFQNQWNKFEIITWNWSIVLPYCTVGVEYAMRKLCATVGTRGNKFEYLPKTKPVQIDWQCLIVLHDVQKPIQIQIQLKICCWGKSKCFTSQVIYVFMKTHRLTSIFLSPFCKESLIGLVLKIDGERFCMVIQVFVKTGRMYFSKFLSLICKESLIGLVLKTDGDCFCMVTSGGW